jgi:hypothetical protein
MYYGVGRQQRISTDRLSKLFQIVQATQELDRKGCRNALQWFTVIEQSLFGSINHFDRVNSSKKTLTGRITVEETSTTLQTISRKDNS